MKKGLIGLAAGAALALTGGTALADGYGYGSTKDAMPIGVPQANWNGLYIGAAVGYGIATNELDLGLAGGGNSFSLFNLDGISSEGFQGTVTLGYDRQIHPNIVLGIFGDYSFGDLETDASVIGDLARFDADITDSWAIGARIGLTPSCCTMWYVTGGYAHSDLDWKLNVDQGSWTASGSKSMDGWFIGGGVEQQLRDNLFVKLDYRYTDYDKVSWVPSDVGGYIDTETDVHSIRLGVNWKVDLFGGHHAAPVPAYEPLK